MIISLLWCIENCSLKWLKEKTYIQQDNAYMEVIQVEQSQKVIGLQNTKGRDKNKPYSINMFCIYKNITRQSMLSAAKRQWGFTGAHSI